MNEIQIQAFWSKIEITSSVKDCWNWAGAKKPSGYGNVRINSEYKLAHRVAFTIHNGEIPPGFIVCHICDNPSCCNPSHLMLGTYKSNAVDMLIKNRQKKPEAASRGINNGMSKLNDKKVSEIRSLHASKTANQHQLAQNYGVSKSVIGSILRNKTWRHVK